MSALVPGAGNIPRVFPLDSTASSSVVNPVGAQESVIATDCQKKVVVPRSFGFAGWLQVRPGVFELLPAIRKEKSDQWTRAPTGRQAQLVSTK